MQLSNDEKGACERPSAFYLRRKRLSSRPDVFDVVMWPGQKLQECRELLYEALTAHSHKIHIVLGGIAFILYHIYLGFAINYEWDKSSSWCDGCRLLIVLTFITYVCVLYYKVFLRFYANDVSEKLKPLTDIIDEASNKSATKWALGILIPIGLIAFYVIDTNHNRQRLISLSGIATILFLGFIFSKHPTQIVWRHVIWGIGLQFVMGLIIIRWEFGSLFFKCISDKVVRFLSYADAGSAFVFDYLATGNISKMTVNSDPNATISLHQIIHNVVIESVFAFQVLPVILYFSFFISILYYYGIMQRVIILFGWLLQMSIGTTAAESMNAAASVFVGMTEAPLMIKPYVSLMTKSEIHAVMAGGFATIAGTVFAAYISFGIDGKYLLSGAVMTAPAALALSKLLYPETEESITTFKDIKIDKSEEKNVLEAATNGAMSAIGIVTGIAAGLLTFISFVQFISAIIAWMGSLVGWDFLSLEYLLGRAFIPLAFLMGVEWKDCEQVGTLLGVKTIINEFVAYKRLTQMTTLTERSRAIATYALCSFSNVASLGTQIGVLGAMIPDRKTDFTEVGVRALCTGGAACFLTACMAGSLINI